MVLLKSKKREDSRNIAFVNLLYAVTPSIYYLQSNNILVNGLSCLVTAFGLIIYHLGEEQVYKPGVWAYFFCVVMEKFLRFISFGMLDYVIPDFRDRPKGKISNSKFS